MKKSAIILLVLAALAGGIAVKNARDQAAEQARRRERLLQSEQRGQMYSNIVAQAFEQGRERQRSEALRRIADSLEKRP